MLRNICTNAATRMRKCLFRIMHKLNINNFPKKTWKDIETVAPDEWDLKMLSDIKKDPDCKAFISSEDAMKELEL